MDNVPLKAIIQLTDEASNKKHLSPLRKGPGFADNWEKGPCMAFRMTHVAKDSFLPYLRPYYFNPKYLENDEERARAWRMLEQQDISPLICYAPENMCKGVYNIQKGEIVWAVGAEYDSKGKAVPREEREAQINKLKALWAIGINDYGFALGLKLQTIQKGR